MLLAIDVGNTTVNIGIFKGRRLIFTRKILTKKPAPLKYYLAEFKKIIKNKKIGDIIISSVVPDTTKALKSVFRNNFGIKPVVLGEDLIVPIKNLYKNPKQVGQDRLVNAYAGYKKFGGGLIIIDFGTAVTFDVISKKGEYVGGIIVPGIETSLSALSEKAALLGAAGGLAKQWIGGVFPGLPRFLARAGQPRLRRDKNVPPIQLIGRDTVSSMLSGILYGFGALCDGLVDKIKKETGVNYKVILTGGHSKMVSGYRHFNTVQPNLTLEGLNLIYKWLRG